MSVLIGVFKFLIFGFYVYSFYIATIYIEKGKPNPCNNYETYTTGDLLTVFTSLMTGMMMVFSLTPNI